MDGQTMLRVKRAMGTTNQESLYVCHLKDFIYNYIINVRQDLRLSYAIEKDEEENRGIKIVLFGELPLNNVQSVTHKELSNTVTKRVSEQENLIIEFIEPPQLNESVTDGERTSFTEVENSLAEESETELISQTVNNVSPLINPQTASTEEKPQKNHKFLTSLPLISLLPHLANNKKTQSLQAPLTELLTSDDMGEILTGLIAVTGLTAGELLKSKKFYPCPDNPFALLFSSTLATTKDQLVTLVEAAQVIDAIARLKSHSSVQPLLYLSPTEIDKRCLSDINEQLLSHLPFENLDEMINTYSTLISTNDSYSETEKLKRPTTTIYNLYTDDRTRLETIAHSLGFDGTQANIFHSLLDWIEQQLNKEATPPSNESLQAIADQAKTLSWLTGEITSLRERVSILEGERDELNLQLEQARLPDPKVETLKTENDRLCSELDKANSTLSVFRQLLNGEHHSTEQVSTNTLSKQSNNNVSTTQNKTVVPSSTQPSLVDSSSTRQPDLVTTSMNDEIADLAQPTKETKESKPTPKTRRTRANGGARQRAIAIFNALQQWNHQHPDNTFALTPALLEVTFHIHRQAAHQFIDEYKEQIAQHHHALGVGTVRTHNRGKDIEPFKHFVEQHC